LFVHSFFRSLFVCLFVFYDLHVHSQQATQKDCFTARSLAHLFVLCLFVRVVWFTRPLAASNTKRLLYRTLACSLARAHTVHTRHTQCCSPTRLTKRTYQELNKCNARSLNFTKFG
jgi:hypothetical protein